MGFFKNLFKKKEKNKVESEDDFDQIIFARDQVDFSVLEQRKHYIEGCLEQIAEAGKEIRILNGEYTLVTSYLTDMEEIEALPEEERASIDRVAGQIQNLERDIQSYRESRNRMPDSEYYRVKGREEEIEEGIRKLKENESYGALIKKDLKRLNGERSAYEFRRAELWTMLANYKGMVTIFITAFVALMGILLILQFLLEKNAQVGFFVAVAALAISLTVMGVRYMDSERELKRIENTINKLILLQNKVKIRYVNNTKLSEYLHIKYDTDSAARLEKMLERYRKEKEERRQFAEAEAKADFYKEELVKRLSNFRIKDPDRWVNQTAALLDKREMVEIRHGLILRRQTLRKQLDYNNEVADTARQEVKDVAVSYPKYAKEIMEMVERYERIYELDW